MNANSQSLARDCAAWNAGVCRRCGEAKRGWEVKGNTMCPSFLPRIMKALTVMQPWAWLIVEGFKDVENRGRNFPQAHRGPLLIHAGLTFDADGYDWVTQNFPHIAMPIMEAFDLGGIVGAADVKSVQRDHPSPWYRRGNIAVVLENPRRLPFTRYRGQQFLFDVDVEKHGLVDRLLEAA